ncbi:DUF58 domain-containing protein [Geomonas sp. RF6]|uniref:DUF58 domain-containing protein n=1 Tax=Geomonas sp. RF6 TaxID=2897342 RepID=UPI001E5A9B9D|nr:DUF58 domain-containing protein [Geomonas sp. RF6]UFS69549.1 DUF58 domain-containing protein [Geomonas sp. RF6]
MLRHALQKDGAGVSQPGGWSRAEIRRLQILSSRLASGIFAGEYQSVFRGRGIEFEEVREYQPGDDVRTIDWNVTARAGRPFVKRFAEEREMTVMLLLDRSPSLDCPSPRGSKSRTAAEVCALLAFAAARSNDRVGLLTCTDRIEEFIPPGKGARHAERIVAAFTSTPPAGRGTDLGAALQYLDRVTRRAATVCIISDFLSPAFRHPLTAAARRHDVVAIAVTDSHDRDLPGVGLFDVTDPESGARTIIDGTSTAVRDAYQRGARARQRELRETFAAAGVTSLEVETGVPPLHALAHFFRTRQRWGRG